MINLYSNVVISKVQVARNYVIDFCFLSKLFEEITEKDYLGHTSHAIRSVFFLYE